MGTRATLDNIKEKVWTDLQSKLNIENKFELPPFVDCSPWPYLSYSFKNKDIEINKDFEKNISQSYHLFKLHLFGYFGNTFNDENVMRSFCKFLLVHEYVHFIHNKLVGAVFDEWCKEVEDLKGSKERDDILRCAEITAGYEGIALAISVMISAEELNIEKFEFWTKMWKNRYLENKENRLYFVPCAIGADYFLYKKSYEDLANYLRLPTFKFPKYIYTDLKKGLR